MRYSYTACFLQNKLFFLQYDVFVVNNAHAYLHGDTRKTMAAPTLLGVITASTTHENIEKLVVSSVLLDLALGFMDLHRPQQYGMVGHECGQKWTLRTQKIKKVF